MTETLLHYCESKSCRKPLVQTPGKKAKRFCNATCRSNQHQKDRRALSKGLPLPPPVKEPFVNLSVTIPSTGETIVYDPEKHEGFMGIMPSIREREEKKKAKKEMPAGLSKTDRLRWMRENNT